MFVAERDLRLLVGCDSQCRIDAIAFESHEVAEAAEVFVDPVYAECGLAVQWLVEIHRDAFVVEGAALESYFTKRREHRFLGNSVYNAAAAATSKDHRVRPPEDLYPLEVVQVAIILHIVANPIQEEVG